MLFRVFLLCLTAMAGLFVWGLAELCFGDSLAVGKETLEVYDLEANIGRQSCSKPILVPVRIANCGDRPGRVLSVEGICVENACAGAVVDSAVTIPPHDEIRYSLELRLRGGSFDIPVVLVLDDGSLRRVPIRIKGEGILSESVPHAP